MARTGMLNMITRLRRMVDDTTAEVWETDDLQEILDAHKVEVYRERLELERTDVSSSSYEYKKYHSRWGEYEENTSGTAYFQLHDGAGSQRGTATYTADYIRGMITMTTDQLGTVLYLTGWSYDLPAAAADCWRERAAKTSSFYDVQADGHKLTRSQWNAQCLSMAREYERQARAVTVRQYTHGVFEHD